MKTQDALRWWQEHTDRGGAEWAQRCLESSNWPHRRHLLAALALLQDEGIHSLFEVGAASGPNLRLIRGAFPHLTLGGVDQVLDPGGQIQQGVLPGCLLDCPEADVYLSMYTLAYLDPDDAHLAIERMEKLARTAIILCEPMPLPGQPEGQHRIDLPEYRHDYVRYTRWKTAWRWPIVPMQDYLNTCVILRPP